MLRDVVGAFDDATDKAFEHLRGKGPADRIFYTASAIGDFGLLWVVFGLLRALRGNKVDEAAALRAIIATGIESVLVNVVLKSFVRRGRPLEQRDHPLPLRQPLSSSFPSGHATAAFCGATLLSDRDRLGPVYFAAASVVALSRIYVRIHHASDVVGGVVVGLVLGQIGKRVFPLRHPR